MKKIGKSYGYINKKLRLNESIIDKKNTLIYYLKLFKTIL